jgi:hypothetical protein
MADESGNAPITAITINLSFDITTRQVVMNVSAQDEMALLYMLEKAKDTLKEYFAKQREGQRIIPAASMPMIRN